MSEKPTPVYFQDALDQYWHDRPPASLEDVMALYGVLVVAEIGGGIYKTPSRLRSYVDDGRLVSIFIMRGGLAS